MHVCMLPLTLPLALNHTLFWSHALNLAAYWSLSYFNPGDLLIPHGAEDENRSLVPSFFFRLCRGAPSIYAVPDFVLPAGIAERRPGQQTVLYYT